MYGHYSDINNKNNNNNNDEENINNITTTATSSCCSKVKLCLYRPWRPSGLREVEAPTFSDIRLIDGGMVVSPTRRPLFTPEKFLVLISVRG
jgi:hypothetical protein